MQFRDSEAKIGKPYRAPTSAKIIEARPSSRSLRELAKFDKQARVISCEIKNRTLRLDLKNVIGDRVTINKRNSIALAKWILEVLNVSRSKGSK